MDLITGLGWEDTLLLETRGSGGKEALPVKRGDRFDFQFSDERECVGFRAPGSSSLAPCPNHTKSISSSQCETCFVRAKMLPCLRCDGSFCRNPVRRSECVVEDNHALYIAGFSDQHLKIGVAKWNRRMIRLAEQGARCAIIIGRDDGQQIRRAESMARALGLPDRLSPTEKLKAHGVECSIDQIHEALKAKLGSLKARMRANWVNPEIFSRNYLGVKDARLLNPEGLVIEGEVHELIGQIITVKDPSGEIIAIDGSSLIGRRFGKAEGSNYQMSLSGQISA